MKTNEEKIKLAVFYCSGNDANFRLAKWVQEAATEIGAEVRLVKIDETSTQNEMDNHAQRTFHNESVAKIKDLEWADALFFSMPTRFGSIPSEVQTFLASTDDLRRAGKLANKVVSAIPSTQNSPGEQEETILSLYKIMYQWGAIVVAPGYTDGIIELADNDSYGTSFTVDADGRMIEDVKEAVKHQAKRTVRVAEAMKNLQI